MTGRQRGAPRPHRAVKHPTPSRCPKLTFWPRYGIWLRSTGKARLEAREADWKRANSRLRIGGSARAKFAASLAPTSLFECFWRMQTRSNRGSVDQYLALHVDDRDRSMCDVTRTTLAVLELHVASKLGKSPRAALVVDCLAGDETDITAITCSPAVRPSASRDYLSSIGHTDIAGVRRLVVSARIRTPNRAMGGLDARHRDLLHASTCHPQCA